uniref:Sorting nexin-13 n=1 Tax=Haemonchus contortus TaxID=6289 RepID=A0A7I4YNA0_HAECO
MISRSSQFYSLLGIALFFGSFGFNGLFVFLICILCFVSGFCYVIYTRGEDKSKELASDFTNLKDFKFPPGIAMFLRNKNRFSDKSMYEQIHSMTNCQSMDAVLEQMLSFVMRDYVDSWYKKLTDDELFKESLRRTARRSVSSLSQCMRQVDWVPFITRHVADDFASHLRLYRMASERFKYMGKKDGIPSSENDLLSHFFDFELEMEKTICRDLLCTTPHYENAYLHDVVDIVLYLIMPPEDFRCRPLRFLLREIIVRRIIIPLLDHFSEPDEMNQILIRLLSEISPRPDDFVACLENSVSIDELEAVYKSVQDEKMVLRGKDSGGEQGVFVKQQLSSLDFVDGLIRKKLVLLTNNTVDSGGLDVARIISNDDGLVQLPLHVVLTNGVAVSYFIDYLQTVGGQNYIDFYLAIEGFKVSVEHQLRTLSNGETVGDDVHETIKEAAQFMYQQYLSQEAITRVPLDESIISKFLTRIESDEPCDYWFEQIQEKVVEILRTDEHFYPGFKKNPLYPKMLAELGITGDEERPETPASDTGSAYSVLSDHEQRPLAKEIVEEGMINDGKPVTTAIVETLGIGFQGKQSFALYNVRVSRSVNGKKVSGWNVLRRYSDFHTLHAFIVHKYPKLSNLSFPGKKTFNNLDAHFLEKRTKALNLFLECVLQPAMVETYPELDGILFDFLSQKEYQGNREPIARKVMSAMFDPIKMSVKAVGNTVLSVPDQVYGGVSKVGAGINNAAKVIIQPLNGGPRAPVIDTDRVAAAITDDESTSDNIPLRVLVLFVDEVFGVRARNAWFRRQMVTVLRQFVTPFGTSINKRIVDLVHWLTSEQQVTMYLTALRDSVWPDGQLAGDSPPRSLESRARARILAKSLMLSALPDELRLILGAETTYTGINTISNALQNKQLNRRLLYVLLERLLITIFPNNRLDKIFARLHSKSPRSKRT